MRKIEKILEGDNVPKSLNGKVTTQYRNDIIEAGRWLPDIKKKSPERGKRYSASYKRPDIKEKLKSIYSNKCGYCEQRVEQFHVDHWRPKATYYWLAFSWDNLIYCCPKCNQFKGDDFEVQGSPAQYSQGDLDNIHQLSLSLLSTEIPKMIHPEQEEDQLKEEIRFNKIGEIESDDPRIDYTVTNCRLNRPYLTGLRKGIFDEIEETIRNYNLEYRNGDYEAPIKLRGYLEQVEREVKNVKTEFILFRRYLLKNWLLDLSE